MSDAHSEWSASGFEQIMLCPGSKVLQRGLPDRSSVYAAEGTAAHTLLAWCLTENKPANAYEGRLIEVVEEDATYSIEVTSEMCEYVQLVADQVAEYRGDDGVLMVEKRVTYGHMIGADRATGWGTADVLIARGDELIVGDLKYGRGVEVDVDTSPQFPLYGLGGVDMLDGIAGDFERVRLVVFQPRVKRAPSERVMSVQELREWGLSTARSAVNTCAVAQLEAGNPPAAGLPSWESVFLRPGEKQCRFCRAKATCPALHTEVALHVSSAPATEDEFEHISDPVTFSEPDLARAMRATDLIEDWCKAVRAEVERRLLAGTAVHGYKLVQGKQGNRAWSSKAEAEEALKAMRLRQDEMYDLTLISPTTAEKLLAKDNPRRWAKLQPLIVRAEGKPSVAPLSDKRLALDVRPPADDFAEVADTDSITDLA